MELRILQYFLMVAREKNITRAAKQLHMTQPTLSQRWQRPGAVYHQNHPRPPRNHPQHG